MSQTIFIPSMLMVGGSGRNVGKTTLICAIIRKYAVTHSIIGLKVTSIRKGEEDFHGNHEDMLSESFKIYEETGLESRKDTSKMLEAGAKKVYFIQSTDYQLQMAMNAFLELEPGNSIIICETRNLRRFIKPGVFIFITDPLKESNKSSLAEFADASDLTIVFDAEHRSMESFAKRISLENGRWGISNG